VKATVLIPTHDHGPTLPHSVASALAQTVKDIEIFIVADGVPEPMRDVVGSVARSDSRIRLFEHPKAPRHGEILRHEAIREASGHAVCYLSDDDLWLPDHVETILSLLETCDFANALPLYWDREHGLGSWTVDLTADYFRQLILSGTNRIPLSCAAHTVAMYRRLPHGWRTTPAGTPTDLYMWQQFLADPGCRARSAARPTVLCFPAPTRKSMSAAERAQELAEWSGRLAGGELTAQALQRFVRECARMESEELANARKRLDAVTRSAEFRAGKKLMSLPLVGALAKVAYRLRDRAASP
jgi:GalNAc5-diNAcBac-PP-undecaprenol beta-1,3-glucosyltransferase